MLQCHNALAHGLGASNLAAESRGMYDTSSWNIQHLPITQILRFERHRGLTGPPCSHAAHVARRISSARPRKTLDTYPERDLRFTQYRTRIKRDLHVSASRLQLLPKGKSGLLPSSAPSNVSKPVAQPRSARPTVASTVARLREQQQTSAIDWFPETPAEEQARHDVFMRRLRSIDAALIELPSDWVNARTCIQKLSRRAAQAGTKAYLDYLQIQREKRIKAALVQFTRTEIQPVEQRLAQGYLLAEDLRRIEDETAKARAQVFNRYEIQPMEHILTQGTQLLQEGKNLLTEIPEGQLRRFKQACRDAMALETEIQDTKFIDGFHRKQAVLVERYSTAVRDTLTLLSDEKFFKAIKLNLIQRGRWKLPYGQTHDSISEYVYRESINQKFFEGAASKKIFEALFGIYWARIFLQDADQSNTSDFHNWRHLDLSGVFLHRAPVIFDFRAQYEDIYVLLHEMMSNFRSMDSQTSVLSKMSPKLHTIVDFEAHIHHMRIILDANITRTARIILLLDSLACAGLRLFRVPADEEGLERTLTFKHAQYAVLGPFLHAMISSKAVMQEFRALHALVFLSQDGKEASNGRRNVLKTGLQKISVTWPLKWSFSNRGLLEAVNLFALWSGMRLYWQRFPQPHALPVQVVQHQFSPDWNQSSAFKLREASSPSSEQNFPQWVKLSYMYPLQPSVAVEYIHNRFTLHFAIKALQPHRIIGVDAVIVNARRDSASLRKPRIQYLMLATDNKILIVHAATLRDSRLTTMDSLEQIWADPDVRKVGVNMALLKQVLNQNYVFHMSGELDLAVQDGQALDNREDSDQNYQLLSSLSSRYLGALLPEAGKPLQFGMVEGLNPMRHFHTLASRAYAALQIYKASTATVPIEPVRELGPLLIDPLLPNHLAKDMPVYLNGQSQAHLRISRQHYMELVTRRMAITFLTRNLFYGWKDLSIAARAAQQEATVKDLQAYFLATTFAEDVKLIQQYLGIENPASRILDVARNGRLPLHPWHQAFLAEHAENEPQYIVDEDEQRLATVTLVPTEKSVDQTQSIPKMPRALLRNTKSVNDRLRQVPSGRRLMDSKSLGDRLRRVRSGRKSSARASRSKPSPVRLAAEPARSRQRRVIRNEAPSNAPKVAPTSQVVNLPGRRRAPSKETKTDGNKRARERGDQTQFSVRRLVARKGARRKPRN